MIDDKVYCLQKLARELRKTAKKCRNLKPEFSERLYSLVEQEEDVETLYYEYKQLIEEFKDKR